MRKLLLLTTFFTLFPLVLVLGLVLYLSIAYQNEANPSAHGLFAQNKTVAFAALPTDKTGFSDEITQQDARTELIRQFFMSHDSPLTEYAQFVVEAADKYDLDFRLIPAIAMQESNLCKKRPIEPVDSHNCWGWGIYSGKVTRFKSYTSAIETVTKGLATRYKEKHNLHTPQEIMKLYNPNSTGSWADGVNFFMDRLQ